LELGDSHYIQGSRLGLLKNVYMVAFLGGFGTKKVGLKATLGTQFESWKNGDPSQVSSPIFVFL